MNNLALAIAVACALAAVGMVAWTQQAMAAMDAELRAMLGPAYVPFDRQAAPLTRSPTRTTLKQPFALRTTIAFVTLLALPLAQAATICTTDYETTKAHISADYKPDKAACASFSANAKARFGKT